MVRGILGVVAGAVGWFLVVAVLGWGMRQAWPAYASVAEEMAFTLPMLFARLGIGAVATLLAGALAAAVGGRRAAAGAGGLLLVGFVPVHVALWTVFPLWYHATFLLSLVPLAVLGGAAAARAGALPAP
ncbi:MAG: hypothetical protein R3F59_06465 [Myxococcota bacterium]